MRGVNACGIAALFSLASGLVAAADGTGITAHHGKVYETAKAGLMTQAFLEIDNTRGSADTLSSVDCPIADSTSIVSKTGAPLGPLAVAAGVRLLLSADGPHLLLQSTHFSIVPGGAIPCSLTFQNAGEIPVYLYPIPAP